MIEEDNEDDWYFEVIMKAEEVEASGLQGKMRALQKKCRSTIVEVSVDSLVVVALVERCLDLEQHVTKQTQTLVEVERKLQAARSAALSAQHSVLEKAE